MADRRARGRRRPLVRRRGDHECRADAKNVVGLVYVAAFAPEEGETLGAAEAGSKDSVLNNALGPRQYPTANGGSATEFYIDPAKARDAFAGDLSDHVSHGLGLRDHDHPGIHREITGVWAPKGRDVSSRQLVLA